MRDGTQPISNGLSQDVFGFRIVKRLLSEGELRAWEEALVGIYLMQAEKIGFVSSLWKQDTKDKKILFYDVLLMNEIMNFFEEHDHEAAYQVLPMVRGSLAAKELMLHSGILREVNSWIKRTTVTAGPDLLPNLPGQKRLLYGWHSEAHYYPKRANFVNVWFPTFLDKTEKNGTMWVCKGSNVDQHDHFIEYQADKNHFVQYEIPESKTKRYDKVPLVCERGDVVLFASNLLHTSTPNTDTLPSYATVMRYFDYSKDLTIAGAPDVTPYSGKDYATERMRR